TVNPVHCRWPGACSSVARSSPADMDCSIVICTANRANALRDTLASLAEVNRPGRVELLVVDNRSTDHTRQIVEEAARQHPFPVRYLFEDELGKYAALN